MPEESTPEEKGKTITIRIPDPWKILLVVFVAISLINLFYIFNLNQKITGMAVLPSGDQGAQPQQPQQPQQPTAPTFDINKIDLSKAQIKGKSNAKVTIVEYSDFQCPYCARATTEAVAQIIKDYVDTGKVRLIFRHFPLSMHQNAAKAAEVAECAGDQGKFWEMHDKLFANQQALDVESLKKYASDLGLDTTKFNTCLTTGAKQSIVQAQVSEGSRFGVTGTPTFFINGKQVVGAQPYEVFKQEIDAAS
jgi:protein-disulfide isomerase